MTPGECTDGVAMIKAEIAKKPVKATLDKLNKALKGAERELGEKEYDECVDFVNDAKKADEGVRSRSASVSFEARWPGTSG